MPKHAESRPMPYSPEQMFDLVADVRRYAEFLPWVVAVRVREDSETEMLADLIVGFKALRETFTSRVFKQRPGAITVDYIEGPMSRLHNEWKFRPDGAGGCIVDFSVDFAFKHRMFEMLAGQVFESALVKMTGAFEERAAALYGAAGSSGRSSSSATSAA